jgi:hypothetical protein
MYIRKDARAGMCARSCRPAVEDLPVLEDCITGKYPG